MDLFNDYFEKKLPGYLDILHQMVGVNSFTSNPEGVNRLGKYTSQVFGKLEFKSEWVPSKNPNYGDHLFLYLNPSSKAITYPPTIALISHLDTVYSFDEENQNGFSWHEEGDRIYGPGTVDIKGGTVMAFMVLEAIRDTYPDLFRCVRWLVALDASEEVLSEDFGLELRNRLPEETLACLVFEGGTPSSVDFPLVVARKGRAGFKVSVEGRSAHAGNNHAQGANAILQIAHTIQEIESFTDYTNQITFNVGTIHGGSVINRVPHYAEAGVEMRAFNPEVFQQGLGRILALNGESLVSSSDGYSCQVSVQITSQTMPWPVNSGTQKLYAIWQEAAKSLNLQTSTEERGGLSDGNLLWDRFPTLDGLGPAGANAHCSERRSDGSKEQEYIQVSSFIPKAKLNALAVTSLLEEYL